MQTIVSLIDFSDVTSRVLEHSAALGRAFGVGVVLVHLLERRPMVVDLGIASPTIMQEPTDSMVEKDKSRLEEFRQALESEGVSATADQWPDDSTEQLVERLRGMNPLMVVIGSHHHGALFKMLVGGIGSDLLKHAPCPVLVVPSAA